MRSIWKTRKKYLILEKHVKATNFKQNWIIRYYKIQKYIQLILAIVLNPYERFIGTLVTVTQVMWHNYVIWHVYLTFRQFLKYAMIFLLQQLVRTAQFTPLAMQCILHTSVKVMKWKYMASLCPYGSAYNAWPTYVTLVGLAAHDVLLSSSLTPGKRLWNLYLRNNSIGFDNSHCI